MLPWKIVIAEIYKTGYTYNRELETRNRLTRLTKAQSPRKNVAVPLPASGTLRPLLVCGNGWFS